MLMIIRRASVYVVLLPAAIAAAGHQFHSHHGDDHRPSWALLQPYVQPDHHQERDGRGPSRGLIEIHASGSATQTFSYVGTGGAEVDGAGLTGYVPASG